MRDFPIGVRRGFGLALFAAQEGETPPSAKPLRGFGGAGVLELIEDERGSTYRAVYTVHFQDAVYVLHVFQKKSKHGIATPKHEMDLIRDRLKLAHDDHASRTKEQMK
jgi:phage-related protein